MASELIKIESHQVPKLENRFRLSDYTPGKFNSIFSKKGIKKAIKKKWGKSLFMKILTIKNG